MRNMQSKVLAKFSEVIEARGFEPVQKAQFANMGIISVEHPDKLGSIMQVRYEFQDTSATFSMSVGTKKIPSQPGRADYFDFYIRYDQPAQFEYFISQLDWQLRLLQPQPVKKRRRA